MIRAAAALLLATATPAVASGLDDEIALGVEGGYACLNLGERIHGLHAGLDGEYVFAQFWSIRAGYLLSNHQGKGDPFLINQLALGARYRLDIFEYVPWIDLSPAVLFGSGEGSPGDVQAGIAAGL